MRLIDYLDQEEASENKKHYNFVDARPGLLFNAVPQRSASIVHANQQYNIP